MPGCSSAAFFTYNLNDALAISEETYYAPIPHRFALRSCTSNDPHLALVHPPAYGDQHEPERIQDSGHLVSLLSRCSRPAVTNERGFKTDPVFGPYGIAEGRDHTALLHADGSRTLVRRDGDVDDVLHGLVRDAVGTKTVDDVANVLGARPNAGATFGGFHQE